MNINLLENTMIKNVLIVISLASFVIYLANKNKQEHFVDINEAYKNHLNKRCTAIYGNYHPKCAKTSRLNHVGYFKFNTIKYPLIDLNNGSYTLRYVMLRDIMTNYFMLCSVTPRYIALWYVMRCHVM